MFPFEVRISPTTYECGAGGSMKVHSLMLHLQEAAARHADILGWGMDWLRKNGAMWVLVNFRMDIVRLPAWNEEFSIFTWPAGHDAIRAFREFKGVAEDGSDLFTATSDWIILDMGSKMPKMLTDVDFKVPDPGSRTLGSAPRLKEKSEYSAVFSTLVGASSLDINTHVNNTEYIRWGFDALSLMGIEAGSIRSFSITFVTEIFQGDKIVVGVRGEGGAYTIRGMRIKDGKTAFLMEALTGP
jgi:acyl-ACP thioesterase